MRLLQYSRLVDTVNTASTDSERKLAATVVDDTLIDTYC